MNTKNNEYLDGIGCCNPENATTEWKRAGNISDYDDGRMGGNCIYLWMSDYHPDGGQLFFPQMPSRFQTSPNPENGVEESSDVSLYPMFVCLGKNTYGDNIRY